jgi:hypothetical protein
MRECAVVGAEAAQFALAPRRGVHGPQQPLLGGLMTPEDGPDAVLHRSQQIRLAHSRAVSTTRCPPPRRRGRGDHGS